MKGNAVAGGGLCAALCVALLFGASYLPVKLAFVFASSIVMGICILRYKTFPSIIAYLVTSLISVFVVPNKLVAFSFVVIFGIYPIVKLHIEKIRNIALEYVIKFVSWNVQIFFMYIVLAAMGQNSLFNVGRFWIWACMILIFLAYDLIFGIVINSFYRTYYKFLK